MNLIQGCLNPFQFWFHRSFALLATTRLPCNRNVKPSRTIGINVSLGQISQTIVRYDLCRFKLGTTAKSGNRIQVRYDHHAIQSTDYASGFGSGAINFFAIAAPHLPSDRNPDRI
jgi:hypothetical protein